MGQLWDWSVCCRTERYISNSSLSERLHPHTLTRRQPVSTQKSCLQSYLPGKGRSCMTWTSSDCQDKMSGKVDAPLVYVQVAVTGELALYWLCVCLFVSFLLFHLGHSIKLCSTKTTVGSGKTEYATRSTFTQVNGHALRHEKQTNLFLTNLHWY